MNTILLVNVVFTKRQDETKLELNTFQDTQHMPTTELFIAMLSAKDYEIANITAKFS